MMYEVNSNAPHSEYKGVGLDGLAVTFEDKVTVAADDIEPAQIDDGIDDNDDIHDIDAVEPAQVHLGQQEG